MCQIDGVRGARGTIKEKNFKLFKKSGIVRPEPGGIENGSEAKVSKLREHQYSSLPITGMGASIQAVLASLPVS